MAPENSPFLDSAPISTSPGSARDFLSPSHTESSLQVPLEGSSQKWTRPKSRSHSSIYADPYSEKEVGVFTGISLGAPSVRDTLPRPPSMASSHMLSASNSDYDSVHRLWRNSGVPSSYKDDEGDSAAQRQNLDAARHRDSELGFPAAGTSPLTRGEAGHKGPADYRSVGLGKYGKPKEQYSAKKKGLILCAVAILIGILVTVIVVPITQVLLKKNDDSIKSSSQGGQGDESAGGTSTSTSAPSTPTRTVSVYGYNGSEIDLGNGKKFMYINNFGGHWVSQPLNDSAQAQNYTPPLDQEFDYINNRILGVNFGGWLLTEPFISPALYEPYENTSSPAVDEFTLSQRYLSEGGASNLRAKMVEHYESFITEQDFAAVAAAGLNWIRLPIGFWALETYDDEPFLEKVSWNYVLKAIQWARKYGLRINIDLHAVPGSQNGYNHSGRRGNINFLQGPMGYANAQRTLNYIRQITEFISQPEVKNVVPMFSIINEPFLVSIGRAPAQGFYSEVYEMMRNITGTGKGNGPYMVIHDGFIQLSSWNGFMPGADRVAYDTHPYLCFGDQNNDPWDVQIMKPCNQYGPATDAGRAQLGLTIGGETSLAVNDCGLYLNGVGENIRYEGTYPGYTTRMGSCQRWDDWEHYDQDMIQGMSRFALTVMDSLHHFFFWTWKIGPSLRTGKPVNPAWSYSLGLQQGWMPKDPLNASNGACRAQAARLNTYAAATTTWNGRYQAWQTGSASSYSPNLRQYAWPPTSLASASAPVTNLPRYTATQPVQFVASPTFSATATVKGDPHPTPTVGNWFNSADLTPMYTPIAGCNYPSNAYDMAGFDGSGWPCSGSS
ncbi:glycoside hydrolase [Violaceomyces palustris]|uniref:Glycoside hydrolase n=1 Tax=Violaceomyces palustris TaxID=1673888 RepID=A0ACD0P102_9BASI|nr:glycoside hydrolase [Violaceomyces palustris]